MADAKSKFSGRAFISLNTTISFIVLIVSSVILYIMPPGRDAYWTDWKLWGLSKDQWGALHTVGGLAFVIFGIIHLIPYNWKVFWNYIISKIRKNLNKKAEMTAALVLNVLIILVCVFNWFPSSTIMDWGASLKNSWVSTSARAPYGHAESETIEVLAQRLGFNLPAALKLFEEKGLAVDPAKTLKFNAEQNKMKSTELYELLAPLLPGGMPARGGRGEGQALTAENPQGEPAGGLREGGGWGRKTVKSYCDELGIEPAVAIEKLKAKGIEAKPGSNLRELGDKAGLSPIQIAQFIKD